MLNSVESNHCDIQCNISCMVISRYDIMATLIEIHT